MVPLTPGLQGKAAPQRQGILQMTSSKSRPNPQGVLLCQTTYSGTSQEDPAFQRLEMGDGSYYILFKLI